MASGPQIYLITPEEFELTSFAKKLAVALASTPVAYVQLRMKQKKTSPATQKAPDKAHEKKVGQAIKTLMPIAHKYATSFIVNDHVILARDTKADGVHLGQQDMPLAQAKALLQADKTLGITCHNSQSLARKAAQGGASYVAFGAFYDSPSKKTVHKAPLNILTWWRSCAPIPCVAIGGITAENASPIAQAGADFLAVCSGVWNNPHGIAKALSMLSQTEYSPQNVGKTDAS